MQNEQQAQQGQQELAKIRVDSPHWKAGEEMFEKAQEKGRGGIAHQKASWALLGGGVVAELLAPAGVGGALWAGGPDALSMSLVAASAGAWLWGRRQKIQSLGEMVGAIALTAARETFSRLGSGEEARQAHVQEARALTRDRRQSAFCRMVAAHLANKGDNKVSLAVNAQTWEMTLADGSEAQRNASNAAKLTEKAKEIAKKAQRRKP